MKGIYIDLETAKKLAQLERIKKKKENKDKYEIKFKRSIK